MRRLALTLLTLAGCQQCPNALELERARFDVAEWFIESTGEHQNTRVDRPVAAPLMEAESEAIEWFPATKWWAESQRTGKPTWILLTHPPTCQPCRQLENEVLNKPNVVETLRRFVCVYVEDEQERARFWRSLKADPKKPYGLFVDTEKRLVSQGVPPLEPDRFITYAIAGWHQSKPKEIEDAKPTVLVDSGRLFR